MKVNKCSFGIELFMAIFILLVYIQIKDQKEGDKKWRRLKK